MLWYTTIGVASVLLVVMLMSEARGEHPDFVRIEVGDDFQAVVDANPPGTIYKIARGIHRLVSVKPEDGDRIIGEYGAILRGSKVLEAADAHQDEDREDLFYWEDQDQQSVSPMEWGAAANEGHEREVYYGNELFVDGERYRHVQDLEGVDRPGTWYFDYEAGRIYMHGDPTDRLVETSVTTVAFDLDGTRNVTIENLYIQHYTNAIRPQGVIRARESQHATIRYVDISYNHAAGLQVGQHMTVENSRFTHNGQIGVVGSASHQPVYFRFNEVAYNLALGFEAGAEGGAVKFVHSRNGLYEHNWIHSNNGYAFWWDIGNRGDVIRSNLVEGGSQRRGIFYEISGRSGNPARIYWNIVRDNDESGIHISNSTNVSIFENAVSGSPVGIVASENNRSPHLNEFRIWSNEIAGVEAQIQIYGSAGDAHRVELIDGNIYRGGNVFRWLNQHGLSFEQWRGVGHDGDSAFEESGAPQLPEHAIPFTRNHYGPIDEPALNGR